MEIKKMFESENIDIVLNWRSQYIIKIEKMDNYLKNIKEQIDKNEDPEFKSILDENGFYLIIACELNPRIDCPATNCKGIKFLYIGHAYEQTLKERITQNHDAYDFLFQKQSKMNLYLYISAGKIKKNSSGSKSLDLVNDIECFIIYFNNKNKIIDFTFLNETCLEQYEHEERKKISLINEGDYEPLIKET